MRWTFFIPGLPVAQARPRATVTAGGHVRMYDPERSRAWKNAVALASLPYKPRQPSTKPIWLRAVFSLPMPKRVKQLMQEHTKRPDVDNLYKGLADALESIFYLNDAQIYSIEIRKQYTQLPGVYVELGELEES